MKFDKFIFEDKNKLLLLFLVSIVIIFGLVHLYLYIKNTNSNNINNKKITNEKFDEILNNNQNLGMSNVIINSLDNVTIKYNKYQNNIKLSKILMNVQTDLNNYVSSNVAVLGQKYVSDELQSLQNNIDSNVAIFNTSLNSSISNVNSNISLNMPTYSIIAYYPPPISNISIQTTQTLPFGWQICDGEQLTTIYNKLTNLKTPNLQSKFILGTGTQTNLTTRSLGDIGGEEKHQLTVSETPNHYHTLMYGPCNYSNYWDWCGWFNAEKCHRGPDPNKSRSGMNTIDGSAPVRATWKGTNSGMSSTGGDKPHNNMPPYYVLIYIIKQPLS